MPMKEAAERYSPEMAEAFQPTETERPATKKSPAVLDLRADQKPIAIVATTVINEKANTHPSKVTVLPRRLRVNMGFLASGDFRKGRFHARTLFFFQQDRAFYEIKCNNPHQWEKE